MVAIDGPSGSGKSTVASVLAEMLGFEYLDTGALYRAVALGLREQGVEPDDSDEKIEQALLKMDVYFRDGKVFLNGKDVSTEIRTPEAGHFSSVFSARVPVRGFLLPVQKRAALDADLVCEGRDMTTVVFPDAEVKIYLDANVEARARRRYLQLRRAGVNVSEQEAANDVMERDKRDSSRDVSPLRVADDAVQIDSSEMSLQEVIRAALEAARNGGAAG